MKNSKKGFTLVELLVVIAILAILATVSIVGYTSFIDRAHVSNDSVLIEQLNGLLLADETLNGKSDDRIHVNNAVAIAEEGGYSIEKLTPTSSGNLIVWDEEQNRFFLTSKDDIKTADTSVADDIWLFVDAYDSNNADHSQYIKGELAAKTTLEVKAGLSVGNNTNVNVKYVASEESEVSFCLNGGVLTVDNKKADVKSYGTKSQVIVKAVANASFHEYGKISTILTAVNGHIALEAGSETGSIIIKSEDISITINAKATLKNEQIVIDENIDSSNIFGKIEGNPNVEIVVGDEYGAAYFAGGNGSEEYPYLISNATHLKNIYNIFQAKGYETRQYYKLISDFTAARKYTLSSFFGVNTPYLYNSVLDGNGHTITGYSDSGVIGQIKNSEVKNLNFEKMGSPVALRIDGTCNIESVNVSGEFEVGGNTGAYTIYSYGTLTFKNCVADVEMIGSADSTVYNAVFVGYSMAPSTNTYIFENCINKGSLKCGRASMFIGNIPSEEAVTNLIINNCENQGVIQSFYVSDTYTHSQFISSNPNYLDGLTIDGTECVPLENVYNNIYDGMVYGPDDADLKITVNANGIFTITPSQKSNVAYYTISLGIYGGLAEGEGSGRFYVSQKIVDINTINIQNIGFVDKTFVEANGLNVYNGEYTDFITDAPIKLVEKDGVCYFYMYDEDLTFNGNVKYATTITITACDAEGNVLASAALTK